ncbi:MAG: hypothetical protein WBZ29_11600 [Methanocella sp.]
MDRFIIVSCFALVVVLGGLVGATAFWSPSAPAGEHYTAASALTTAEQFVNGEATYKYDGDAGTLKVAMSKTIDANTYEIVADFTSRAAGFGDRTGMMVAEVLTSHKAVITVNNGKVVSAIMDSQWDMLTQKMLSSDVSTLPATMPALDPTTSTPPTQPEGAYL